jgi:cytochrome c-type biogenesis protein CcmF
MIPELGQFSLWLALGLALVLGGLPLAGAMRGDGVWMRTAFPLATGVFVFTGISFVCLLIAFVGDDFSVSYVAQNSNTRLPIQYKISAIWGAHEGSFLLWTLIMAGWTVAVAWRSQHLPLVIISRVLAIMGLVTVGFLLFMLLTSNPFDRALPMPPTEGADLNPMLQDFGLIVHPPMLYAGYVGFSVVFAFALAALMTGKLDAAWARWSRPWTNVAWAFLTLGIALGSWWAYYELGWGGWWFWDPVENASFMPWLTGTALIHSLAVTEKRGVFKSWTVLLAIATFSLALLGAFIVRSGVLTSVHSFAVDPERGLFILVFLILVVGGSLTLYAFRAPAIHMRAQYGLLSREALLLLNNALMMAALAVVFVGTLYPLAYEAATGGSKISVGPPYFNSLFVPLMVVVAVLLGVTPFARWKRTGTGYLVRQLAVILAGSVALGVLIPLLLADVFKWPVVLATMLGLWVVGTHLKDLWVRAGGRLNGLAGGLMRVPRAHYGMVIAHVGFAVVLVGVTVTTQHSLEKDVRMHPGDAVIVGDRQYRLTGVSERAGPNFIADRASIEVVEGNRSYFLYPERRHFFARDMIMAEAAIRPSLGWDIYLALGEPMGDGSWAVRVHDKPLVRWIWLGALLMGFGGIWSILDKRYRRRVSVRESQPRTRAPMAHRPQPMPVDGVAGR